MRIAAGKRNGGYFTIEAAFIGTMASMLVIAFVYVGLYHFDLGVTDSYLKTQSAMITDMNSGTRKTGTKQDLQRLLTLSVVECFSVRERADSVLLEAQISIRIPIPVVSEWIGNRFCNRISIVLEKSDIQTRMRRWDQIE